MRLIDADVLLARVDEERKYLIARGQTGAEHILVHNFRDLIENAPTVPLPDFKEGYKQAIIDGKTNDPRPEGEWIAVKDKLPDTDGYYLVSLENGQIVVAHSSGIIENHDFEPKMLAWQPLPEPYK